MGTTMNFRLCQETYYYVIFCLVLAGMGNVFVSGAYHYPADRSRPKPCTRRMNTILYQQPICQVDENGEFVKESVANCIGSFRATCPEFNFGSCQWYNGIPCCRLKYYATGYTWMEIYYSHQYENSSKPKFKNGFVYDIVEIHRFIKNHEHLPRDQEDWPKNVLNSSQERGLSWTIVNNLSHPLPIPKGANLCEKEGDGLCIPSGPIYDYIQSNYKQGFKDLRSAVQLSAAEKAHNVSESISLDLKCVKMLKGDTVTPACQILYWRHAARNTNGESYDTSFIYLEAQIYQLFEKDKYALRYAYWSEEPADNRDDIFGTR